MMEAQPIETCPKEPDTPYVLLHRNGNPVVAEWEPDGFGEPCWDLWLGGEHYGAGIDASEIIGWFPVKLPRRDYALERKNPPRRAGWAWVGSAMEGMVRTVIYDAEDMEPITVIDVPREFIRMIEDDPTRRELTFAVLRPFKMSDLMLPPDTFSPQDIDRYYVRIRFEPIYKGRQKLMWLATTMNGETALLLKSVFLPGQQAAVNEGRDEAFMRGMLAAMGIA